MSEWMCREAIESAVAMPKAWVSKLQWLQGEWAQAVTYLRGSHAGHLSRHRWSGRGPRELGCPSPPWTWTARNPVPLTVSSPRPHCGAWPAAQNLAGPAAAAPAASGTWPCTGQLGCRCAAQMLLRDLQHVLAGRQDAPATDGQDSKWRLLGRMDSPSCIEAGVQSTPAHSRLKSCMSQALHARKAGITQKACCLNCQEIIGSRNELLL